MKNKKTIIAIISAYVSFTTKNDRSNPEGFQLTGKTRAGQTKTISITVNP